MFARTALNIGTLVMRITKRFDRDLGEFAGECGMKTHQKTHYHEVEL